MSACRDLTFEEFQACVAACQGSNGLRDRVYFQLGACTGFRVSELLTLTRADVVDYRGEVPTTIYVDKKDMKKKTAGRGVPVPETLRAALREHLADMEKRGFVLPGDALFCNRKSRRGIGRQAAWKMIRRRAMAAKIDIFRVGTHSLRKTLAAVGMAHYVARGDVMYLQKIQAALGHKEITSTTKYLHTISAAQQAEGFAAVERFVFPNGAAK